MSKSKARSIVLALAGALIALPLIVVLLVMVVFALVWGWTTVLSWFQGTKPSISDIGENWGNVIIGVAAIVPGVIAVFMTRQNSRKIDKVKDDTTATRDHTVNSHGDRIMRIEMDERDSEYLRRFSNLEAASEKTSLDIGGMRSEIREDRRQLNLVRDDVAGVSKGLSTLTQLVVQGNEALLAAAGVKKEGE